MRPVFHLFLSTVLLCTGSLWSQQVDHGFAIKASTLGAGLEYQRNFQPKTNFRLGFNTWTYDQDGTEGGIQYQADLELRTLGLIVDYHPWEGIFRVSGGVMYNGNELEMQASLATAGTVDIGGRTYTIGANDFLRNSVEFNKIAPYVGLGWGNALSQDKKWGFLFDIGLVVQGDPDINVSTSDFTTSNAGITADQFATDVAAEKKELEDALDSFNIYPVVSLGISYKF